VVLFHTFNRTPELADRIKGGMVVKNTPENMHVYELF